MKRPRELAGIEVLRFLCAIAVVLWHYQHFMFFGTYDDRAAEAVRGTLPLHALFFAGYEYGYWAIQVFWAISGFIFYRQYAESVHDHNVGFSEFAIRRFSRLYPLHFATLLLVTVGQTVYVKYHGGAFIFPDTSRTSFAYQLFFASSWFPTQSESFNGPVWSVSAEILIYVVFFGIARKLGPNPFVALVAALICWLLFRSHLADGYINYRVFICGVFFFAGGIVERLCRYRLSLLIGGLATVAIVVLLALHLCDLDLKSALVLSTGAVLVSSQVDETRAGFIIGHLSFLGNATYSSYLVHFPLELAVVNGVDGLGLSRSLLFHPVSVVAYLAAVVVISLAVYRLFERPVQDWIRNGARRFIRQAAQSNRIPTRLR